MIIGLVGFIGSGKGTVGDLFVEYHGFVKDSFARPLKDAVAAIFGWDRKMLEGDTPESRAWREQPDEFWSKKFGRIVTPRWALQLMGTEAGRNIFHEDIWVASLIHRAGETNTVVTDVRFKNEIKAIEKAGGAIVRVRRGPDPDWYRTAENANDESHPFRESQIWKMKELNIHQSEWDWIGCRVDITIYNDGSLEDLRTRVYGIITPPDPEYMMKHLTSVQK